MRTITHNLHGIFRAFGPSIQAGQVAGPTLIDMAPTIPPLLDHTITLDVGGKGLEEIFSPDFLGSHSLHHSNKPVRYDSLEAVPELTSEEGIEVPKHLRGLGYV